MNLYGKREKQYASTNDIRETQYHSDAPASSMTSSPLRTFGMR